MSSNRLRTTLLTLVIALSPSTALAQSAGDDQYEDPFGDEAPQSAPPGPSATPSPVPEPDGGSAVPEAASGAGDPEAAPAASATPVPRASSAGTPAGELPRTGADAGILGTGGTALVLCGIALRLRLAHGGGRRA